MTKRISVAVALACAAFGGAMLICASGAQRVQAATPMPDLIVDQAALR